MVFKSFQTVQRFVRPLHRNKVLRDESTEIDDSHTSDRKNGISSKQQQTILSIHRVNIGDS